MALYLGIDGNGTFVSSDGYTLQDSTGLSLSTFPHTSKLKININGIVYRLNINLPEKESE